MDTYTSVCPYSPSDVSDVMSAQIEAGDLGPGEFGTGVSGRQSVCGCEC